MIPFRTLAIAHALVASVCGVGAVLAEFQWQQCAFAVLAIFFGVNCILAMSEAKTK